MTTRLRALLLACLASVAFAVTPARAEDPTLLVAARADGSLVQVTLTGRTASTRVLVPARAGTYLVPTHARGTSVAFVAVTETRRGERADVGLVDATTGARRSLSRDGRSGYLLVSPDRAFRYVIRTTEYGNLASLVRIDARTGRERTLVAAPRRGAPVSLSGAGISPDGRTVYVARTASEQPPALLAVDTRTGARREIRPDRPLPEIVNVVASPDGTTLAVSYLAGVTSYVRLLSLAGGTTRDLASYTDVTASAFTADGSGVVLSAPIGLPEGPMLPVDPPRPPSLAIADVATGAVVHVARTEGLFQAIPAG